MSRITELTTAFQPVRDNYQSTKTDFTTFEVLPVEDRTGYFVKLDASWIYGNDYSDDLIQEVYDKFLELVTDETALADLKYIKFINSVRKAVFI